MAVCPLHNYLSGGGDLSKQAALTNGEVTLNSQDALGLNSFIKFKAIMYIMKPTCQTSAAL